MTGSDEDRVGGHERLGSAAEEAAKLFGALSGWAGDMGDRLEDHLATGASECTYCPICRTVHVVREASPEIRTHLTSAAVSLLQAGAALLAAAASSGAQGAHGARRGDGRSGGVERIDLGDFADEADLGDDAAPGAQEPWSDPTNGPTNGPTNDEEDGR